MNESCSPFFRFFSTKKNFFLLENFAWLRGKIGLCGYTSFLFFFFFYGIIKIFHVRNVFFLRENKGWWKIEEGSVERGFERHDGISS